MSRGGRRGRLVDAIGAVGGLLGSVGSVVSVDEVVSKSQFIAMDVKGALACSTALSKVMVPSETFSSCASRV